MIGGAAYVAIKDNDMCMLPAEAMTIIDIFILIAFFSVMIWYFILSYKA